MFAASMTASVSTRCTSRWILFTNEQGRAEKTIVSVSGRLNSGHESFDVLVEVRYLDGASYSDWVLLGDGENR